MLLVNPEHRLSLQLKQHEMRTENVEMCKLLQAMQEEPCVDLVDESDEGLDPRCVNPQFSSPDAFVHLKNMYEFMFVSHLVRPESCLLDLPATYHNAGDCDIAMIMKVCAASLITRAGIKRTIPLFCTL